MRSNGLWASLLIVVLVVGAGVAGLIALFLYTNTQFVLGVFGVGVAIITASINYRAAKEKEIDSRLFADKRTVYTELVGTVMGLFHDKKINPTEEEQKSLVKKLQGLRTQLLVWGSADTLQALDQMSGLQQPDTSGLPIAGTRWLARLFSAIRKDLGHKDPPGAALEMALGMLNEPDRSNMRAAMAKLPN